MLPEILPRLFADAKDLPPIVNQASARCARDWFREKRAYAYAAAYAYAYAAAYAAAAAAAAAADRLAAILKDACAIGAKPAVAIRPKRDLQLAARVDGACRAVVE